MLIRNAILIYVCLFFDFSGGVRIFIPPAKEKISEDLLEICGKITNQTFLIEGGDLNLIADGFEYFRYHPILNRSRILAHYRSEFENITTITGRTWCFQARK